MLMRPVDLSDATTHVALSTGVSGGVLYGCCGGQ